MVQRFVRVRLQDDSVAYGHLEINRTVTLLNQAPWEAGEPIGVSLDPGSYQLLAPCQPSKIIGVGRNYVAHAAEMQSTVPTEPLLFLKPPTTVAGPDQTIVYPLQSQQVEYEGELALVIGKPCHNCMPDVAHRYVWGYTIANDITARDLQRTDAQWTRGKGFDGFCPLGPWIVRDIGNSALLQTYRNDDPTPRQKTTIDTMVFAPERLVAYISQVMTLMPGDIILTGTPAGVGAFNVGDRISVTIEGIGTLSNTMAAQPQPEP
ncbi:MAG TPA: fumarylacetoacetate hydrolase family protein [Stenomitos sp.]